MADGLGGQETVEDPGLRQEPVLPGPDDGPATEPLPAEEPAEEFTCTEPGCEKSFPTERRMRLHRAHAHRRKTGRRQAGKKGRSGEPTTSAADRLAVITGAAAAIEAALDESQQLVDGCLNGFDRLIEKALVLRKAYIAKSDKLRKLQARVDQLEARGR